MYVPNYFDLEKNIHIQLYQLENQRMLEFQQHELFPQKANQITFQMDYDSYLNAIIDHYQLTAEKNRLSYIVEKVEYQLKNSFSILKMKSQFYSYLMRTFYKMEINPTYVNSEMVGFKIYIFDLKEMNLAYDIARFIDLNWSFPVKIKLRSDRSPSICETYSDFKNFLVGSLKIPMQEVDPKGPNAIKFDNTGYF